MEKEFVVLYCDVGEQNSMMTKRQKQSTHMWVPGGAVSEVTASDGRIATVYQAVHLRPQKVISSTRVQPEGGGLLSRAAQMDTYTTQNMRDPGEHHSLATSMPIYNDINYDATFEIK